MTTAAVELRELRQRREHLARAARYDRDLQADIDEVDEQIADLEHRADEACPACAEPRQLVDGVLRCTWASCPESTVEQDAIREDAERRLGELRAVARSLWPDRDDPAILSELSSLMPGIRAAEEALG